MNSLDLLRKCTEDLTAEFKKVAEQRDALKTVAKEVLFVLEKHDVDHELQERLQLAICNLPEGSGEGRPSGTTKANEREGK